jgi:hypothetical protein
VKVELRSLKDNPLRDFRVDPIDDTIVENLKKSIKEDGFWGGVACRKKNGEFQIAAGHHRVRAAIATGVREADLFVSTTMTDSDMVRIYARENATQRGQSSTALAGSVVSAIRFIARGILASRNLEEVLAKFGQDLDLSEHGYRIVRGGLLSDIGIGEDIIVKFLHDTPGINKGSVGQQLVSLKSSGEYARIISEVKDEIGSDDEEIGATAQRAVEAANNREVIFDMVGVSHHLDNPHQVDVFRSEATRPAVRRILPVANQARVVREIVQEARREGVEVTGRLISDHFQSMVLEARQNQRHVSREERNDNRVTSWETQLAMKQRDFVNAIKNALGAAVELAAHERRRPEDATLHRVAGFSQAVRHVRKLAELMERLQ